MTDSSKPRPRPRPRPEPGEPPQAATNTDADRPRTTRAERLRVERRARRRTRSRRAFLAAAIAAAVAAGVATLVVVRAGGGSAAPTPAPSTPASAGSGAQLAQPDAATAYLAGAVSDIAAVTSYDYRTLDEALSNGLAVTTGAYRDAYRIAMTGELATSARRNHTVQTFDVLRVGIGSMTADGNEAKVLVFGEEHVTGDTAPATPGAVPVTLCATIRRDGSSYLIGDLVEGANAGLPQGSTEPAVAAESGRQEVVNLLSYRRSDFALDYARALAGATGALQREIVLDGPRTKSSITQGRYDLRGTVTAVAVERAAGDRVTLLVAATGTRVDDDGHERPATDARYEVTVEKVSDAWLAGAITPVAGGS
jgi:hypothetical protein